MLYPFYTAYITGNLLLIRAERSLAYLSTTRFFADMTPILSENGHLMEVKLLSAPQCLRVMDFFLLSGNSIKNKDLVTNEIIKLLVPLMARCPSLGSETTCFKNQVSGTPIYRIYLMQDNRYRIENLEFQEHNFFNQESYNWWLPEKIEPHITHSTRMIEINSVEPEALEALRTFVAANRGVILYGEALCEQLGIPPKQLDAASNFWNLLPTNSILNGLNMISGYLMQGARYLGNASLTTATMHLFRATLAQPVREPEIPNEYYCPISAEIMWDPVTLPSGHTYNRTSLIALRASTGTLICPISQDDYSQFNEATAGKNIFIKNTIEDFFIKNPKLDPRARDRSKTPTKYPC